MIVNTTSEKVLQKRNVRSAKINNSLKVARAWQNKAWT